MKRLLFLLLLIRVAYGQATVTIPVTNKFVPLPDSISLFVTPTQLSAAVAANVTSITVDYPIVAVSPTHLQFSSTYTDSLIFKFADANTDAMLTAMGSTIKAYPMASPYPSSANASGLTNDQINFMAVYLPTAQTITGVKFSLTQTGSYTATGYNGVALYSVSGGTLTLQASSTNNAAIWTGSTGVITSQAFSSTYSAAAGLYYIAIAYDESAQVTQPKLGDVLGIGTANLLDFTNNNRFSGFLASNNTLPTPTEALSSLGNGGSQFWVALY